MARFLGPKSKVARKFGEPIMGFSKALEKKPHAPGMHGTSKRKKQASEYGTQLKEKQKAKLTYGLLERQFAKTYGTAVRRKGVTGENLLKLLESRLDNTVYRLGIAPTRRGARQLVSHRHIAVNGRGVNVPSFCLKAGDVVSVRDASKKHPAIAESLNVKNTSNFPWLEWNGDAMKGTFLTAPERDQIPENIREQLIVELYSK